jgi:hypothetical protein
MVDATTLAALGFQVYRYLTGQNEKKPRIRVTASPGFLSQGAMTSPAMLILKAANPGHVPVTLTSFPSLQLPDDKQLILTEAQGDFNFPHTLAPGTACQVWREMKQVARELSNSGYTGQVKIVGEFKDAVGNSYRSKPFTFDVDGWTRNA